MPTRRDVLRGLAGGAAALTTGLLLPDRALVVPEVETVRRYWWGHSFEPEPSDRWLTVTQRFEWPQITTNYHIPDGYVYVGPPGTISLNLRHYQPIYFPYYARNEIQDRQIRRVIEHHSRKPILL